MFIRIQLFFTILARHASSQHFANKLWLIRLDSPSLPQSIPQSFLGSSYISQLVQVSCQNSRAPRVHRPLKKLRCGIIHQNVPC